MPRRTTTQTKVSIVAQLVALLLGTCTRQFQLLSAYLTSPFPALCTSPSPLLFLSLAHFPFLLPSFLKKGVVLLVSKFNHSSSACAPPESVVLLPAEGGSTSWRPAPHSPQNSLTHPTWRALRPRTPRPPARRTRTRSCPGRHQTSPRCGGSRWQAAPGHLRRMRKQTLPEETGSGAYEDPSQKRGR